MGIGHLEAPGPKLRERTDLRTDARPNDAQLLQRFTDASDEAAFADLVRRHGPMVLAVCRRILNHDQDAADAFQATFLVLVRKAASLSQPEMLGSWLYGVAYRTALKARARESRRRAHERQVANMHAVETMSAADGQQFRAELDEELNRLPEKFRAPLVLCYLEGKTHEEAARLLDCPPGSMSWRLARAQEALRARLVRRSPAGMPCAAMPVVLFPSSAPAAIPADLVHSTAHAAKLFASGAGGISESVAGLTEEVLNSMARRRSPWTLALLLAALLALSATGAWASGLVLGPAQGNKAAGPQPGADQSPAGGGCGGGK
jgi:RNA polymerase sigma factor (sigma-70 family)